METLPQDLRFGLRAWRKAPGFTAASVLTLALAIGANTTVFSLVNAVLVRQLPYRQPEQLVWVWATRTDRDKAFFSIPNFLDTRERQQSFAQLAAFANWGANLTGNGEPERLPGVRLSAEALRMLGVEAVAGRTLLAEDDNPNKARVVVLSYGLWQRRFGGHQNVIGQPLTLNGEAYTVVGVAGNVKHVGLNDEPTATLYGPLAQVPPSVVTSRAASLSIVARVTNETQALAASVRSEVRAVDPQAPASHARTMAQFLAASVAARRFNLLLLSVFAGAALLLAAAGLYAVISYSVRQRTRELGIRLALGANAAAMQRLVIGQGLRLALLGVAVGLLAAFALTRLLTGLLFEVSAADPLTFVLVVVLLLLIALAACWIPARRATKVDPMIALRCE